MTPIVLDTESGGSRGLEVGDLDGDGDLDIASVNTNAGTTTWYENTDPKTNTFVKRTLSTNTTGARDVHLVDLDRDGDLEVLVANTGLNLLTAFLNDGQSPPSFSPLNISFNAPSVWSLAHGDFNGDQRIDVLSGNSSSGAVVWFENDVDFSFADVDTGLDGADLAASEYDRPADLKVLTEYRWQVDAKNLLRKTSGDVWTFSTGLPDLEILSTGFVRGATNDNIVDLSFTLGNVGKSRVTTGTVQLLVSRRGEPIRSSSDLVIGYYEYGTILPGQTVQAEVRVNLDKLPNQPSGVANVRLPEGTYFFVFDADHQNTEFEEFDEHNLVKNRFAISYIPSNSAGNWTHYE
jgi:hypothetical protein